MLKNIVLQINCCKNEKRKYPSLQQLAHYYSFKSNGEDTHFYPGNGLPNGVYQTLLNLLCEKYKITSLAYRATWENAKPQNNSWRFITEAGLDKTFLPSYHDLNNLRFIFYLFQSSEGFNFANQSLTKLPHERITYGESSSCGSWVE